MCIVNKIDILRSSLITLALQNQVSVCNFVIHSIIQEPLLRGLRKSSRRGMSGRQRQ